MTLRLTNTLTRTLETWAPLVNGEARLYTCGPTVYNRVHIGNLRTFVWEDLLCRTLRGLGLAVTQVMNLTDIDDKTIRGAVAEGLPLREFTEKHVATFHEDMKTLGVIPADVYPRATEHIDEMVALVKRLMERGHTYESDGSIWFRIASFPAYGKLSRIDLAKVKRGARVADDEYEKEDAKDFSVWKAAKEGEPESATWTTDLGRGRPGWHLECSAMSMKYLGETFDIHTGAVDNIFPHHENEIAQSEGATGKPFVKMWLHAEHLIVDGEKMSKSKGNFYTLPDVIARGHSPRAIRYLLLSVPYRQKLNFTFEGLAAAESALERVDSLDRRLRERAGDAAPQPAGGAGGRSVSGAPNLDNAFVEKIEAARSELWEGLGDDLNTAAALSALFVFVKETNADLESRRLAPGEAARARLFVRELDRVFGFLVPPGDPEETLEASISAQIAARQDARKRRDFKASDAIRDELAAQGILLEDTPEGVRWKRK